MVSSAISGLVFQVFLLQGVLCWLVSAPLLAAMFYTPSTSLNYIDYLATTIWIIGFLFEAVGDYQLTRFKNNPSNKDKLLQTGLWKYTRHPNYFGDATVWWAFGLFSVAVGNYIIKSYFNVMADYKNIGSSYVRANTKGYKTPLQSVYRKNKCFFSMVFEKIICNGSKITYGSFYLLSGVSAILL